MLNSKCLRAAITLATLTSGAGALADSSRPWLNPQLGADERAQLVVNASSKDEQLARVRSEMAMPILGFTVPEGALGSAAFVPADKKYGIPALQVTDASLGVANPGNVRPGDGGTPLPSGLSLAASWSPKVAYDTGAMIGNEAWRKGFNILLAGGINLARDPRNGRNFEYFGEDPLLAGVTAGESIRGIQSQHVLSTIKHFAMNNQETSRYGLSANISERAMRESDLLAFQIAIERGQPGAVMCGYNRINGVYACEHPDLLQRILKDRWKYRGFVMSDWGAVHSVEAALKGLDIEMGTQLDKMLYGDIPFDKPLAAKVQSEKQYQERLADMNQRILRSIFAAGLVDHPPIKGDVDYGVSREVARIAAQEGSVLLRNEKQALPIPKSTNRILVVGGNADVGVLSGAGSAQVVEPGGPALSIRTGGEGIFASLRDQVWHRSSPLLELKKALPGTTITFNDGRSPGEAAALAKNADVVIVFATQWMMETYDTYDLNLPQGQDAVIDAVASANPNTVVVLETGGPVAMPWLKKSAAVLQAWYPGAEGGRAIADLLTGVVSPSGRLPVTFPESLAQLPRPEVPGFGGNDHAKIDVDYNIEGADVGYRWFARKDAKPLFPFGYGLTYSTFSYGDLKVESTQPLKLSATVTNTGKISAKDVPQIYLSAVPGRAEQRLLSWDKLSLKPGESQRVTFTVDDRLLADFDAGKQQWVIAEGTYSVALGHSANDLVANVNVDLAGSSFADKEVSTH